MNLKMGSALLSQDTVWTLLIAVVWLWWIWHGERRWFPRTAALVVCVGGIASTLWWRLQTVDEWKANLVFVVLLMSFILSRMLYHEWRARGIISRS
jgi:hypothetical protein